VDCVNILGEALDGLGRWYVAVPPFLDHRFPGRVDSSDRRGSGTLAGSSERLQKSAQREHLIDQLQIGVSRSVAAQRSFLLTGDQKFLEHYDAYVAEWNPGLERLQSAYRGSDPRSRRHAHAACADRQTARGSCDAGRDYRNLRAPRLRSRWSRPASARMPARPSTMSWSNCGERESAEHLVAEDHWSRSLTLSRWITVAGTIFNMLLVGIAARLVYLDLRRPPHPADRGTARSEAAARTRGGGAESRARRTVDPSAKRVGARKGRSGARIAR